jgi:uncharacterized tellurite resistance protein B-like protein
VDENILKDFDNFYWDEAASIFKKMQWGITSPRYCIPDADDLKAKAKALIIQLVRTDGQIASDERLVVTKIGDCFSISIGTTGYVDVNQFIMDEAIG